MSTEGGWPLRSSELTWANGSTRRWIRPIGNSLAYLDTGGMSNGPTEASNLLIKRSSEAATVSATWTTTASATAALRRRMALNTQQHSEAGYHACGLDPGRWTRVMRLVELPRCGCSVAFRIGRG